MGKQFGILVDIATCIGCKVCMVACKQVNNLEPSNADIPGSQDWIHWINILDIGPIGDYPNLQLYHLPINCQHCGNAVCIGACPKAAISKLECGVVQIDKNRCDGCKDDPDYAVKCIQACPFRAFQLNPKTHKAEGCTLCLPLISKGLEPACVRACPGGCLTFGNLKDPRSLISKRLKQAADRAFTFRPEQGTRPSVWYIAPDGWNAEQWLSAPVVVGKNQILFCR
jgi:Fe-S-cluster-containing dehydrogenase component